MLPTISKPIDETSAEMLDFPQLRELVSSYASTEAGRAWTLGLEPSGDAIWAAAEQQRVDEMLRALRVGMGFDFHGLIDPDALLERARIAGAMLEVEELRSLAGLTGRFRAFQEWMRVLPQDSRPSFAEVSQVSESRPGAPKYSTSLRVLAVPLMEADFSGLFAAIDGKFEPDGSIADHASPELARIRRQMEQQQRAIEESLRAMLRRMGTEGALQEDLITVRGERFVLPVKAEWKRRVPGVLHGASSSGQTFFIEPMETIEQNNELQRLLEEEQEEVRRILAAMTRQVALHADAIAAGARVLAEMDSLGGRARFAQDFRCTMPAFAPTGEGRILLKAARHPLLEKRLRDEASDLNKTQVSSANLGHPKSQSNFGKAESLETRTESQAPRIVPLDMEMSSDAPQLVISGPNTGGKTVVLKTVGLLALMAQAGIPVPAESAELPVFDAVLADIGDAQSIAQNLSTFSAHIARTNRIARLATENSLVLLDELGSATDPEEGAALAAAIAAHFADKRAWCLISTHHTSLKVYAANTLGVRNAAAGFDERTFAPTYKIRMGVPGVSAGIAIAERLGLEAGIAANARERLGKQSEEIGRFLDKLHADLLAVNQERARLERREEELTRERQRLEREGQQEQRQKVRELEGKLTSLLKDFEYRMRETLGSIEDRAAQQKAAKQAERGLAKLRREFREQVDATVVAHRSGADQGDPNAQPHIVRNIAVGDTVKLRSLGKNARVERQLDADHFEVTAGALKMRIDRSDVAEVVAQGKTQVSKSRPFDKLRAGSGAPGSKGIRVTLAKENAAATEINVIGRTVDEATDAVEKFLDDAFLAGLPQVRIVHGSGMGVLRKALRAYLTRHPHVGSVSEPPQNEGGAGATVVELRQ